MRTIDGADMSEPGLPRLDQLRMLMAVAESGSFSAAGRRLNRSQSVVSYTIAALEAQLGVALFDRTQRRPELTEAGRAVLADAHGVASALEALRSRVGALRGGVEAELAVAVDVMFPVSDLVAALQAFAQAFPTVALRLHVEALGAVVQLVQDGACGLGIGDSMATASPCLVRTLLTEVELAPVAAPSHALARLRGPIPLSAVRDQIQLVLADRSRLTDGRDFGVLSHHTWRLADLGAKHALLRAGLGWGNMPLHMVSEDLGSGMLRRLAIEGHERLRFPLVLVRRADRVAGPAERWLADRLTGICRPAESRAA